MVQPCTSDLPDTWAIMEGTYELAAKFTSKFCLTTQENDRFRPVHVSPHHPLEQYWWTCNPSALLNEIFHGPNSKHSKDQIAAGLQVQRGDMRKSDTSAGTVAENSSVCRSLGMEAIIFSISLLNPISNRRSASSRTRTFTPLIRAEKPGVFWRWSMSLPGVATRICLIGSMY